MTTLKILADTVTAISGQGVPIYLTSYTLSAPAPNGHQTGAVETEVGSLTESTFNLTIQERVATLADDQSAGTEEFNASHVFGGRI